MLKEVREILEQVTDPEIPVLTIADLGILRDVRWNGGGIQAVITPTLQRLPRHADHRAGHQSHIESERLYGR